MAKKAAKKEAVKKVKPAAKKAAAKPAPAKKAVKAAPAKPAAKAAAPKPAAKAAAPVKPAKAPPKVEAKPVKAIAPKPEKPAPKIKEEKIVAKTEKVTEVAAPKAAVEKRPKLDKTGMSDEQVRWHDLQFKHRAEKPQVYNMTAQFEANKPIQHKVLGWGFVLSNENDRLEVLFEQGIKMLISNYKAG